jgi:hypothetical protein
VSKPVNDILLIRKYLAGELDARAMHELERRALDDPFLADALDGYGHAKSDQQKNLAKLSARLNARTDKKVRMLTPRMQLSIAASLLIIISAGAWLVIRNQNTKQRELKQVVVNVPSVPKPVQPVVSAPSQAIPHTRDTVVKEKAIATTRFTAPVVVSQKADAEANQPPAVAELQAKEDSGNAKLAAVKTPGYSIAQADKQPQADQYKSAMTANDAIVQSLNDSKFAAKKTRPMLPETLLNAHEDNLMVNPARGNNSTVVGYVTGNNQPIVGAIVKLTGADFGVVTDVNGRFVVHNVSGSKSLMVKSLGYATRQVKLNGRDSINVALEPTANALAEVVTLKPARNSNDDGSSGSTGAHPGSGWKALNDYLDKNAISPDNKAGNVVLSFTVDSKGALTGFKVIQSLSNTDDQKVIDLISNGPAWTGNSDGQPHEVKVTVVFH